MTVRGANSVADGISANRKVTGFYGNAVVQMTIDGVAADDWYRDVAAADIVENRRVNIDAGSKAVVVGVAENGGVSYDKAANIAVFADNNTNAAVRRNDFAIGNIDILNRDFRV